MTAYMEHLRTALFNRYRIERELGAGGVRGLTNPRSAPSATGPEGRVNALRLSRRLGAISAAEPAFERRRHGGGRS